MKRVLLVTTGFGLLAATATAIAADLPYRNQMPVKAPAYGPIFTWTGFYVGVNGGGAFGTSTYNFGGLGSASFNTSGGLAGGTIGFNYQTGALVWGVRATAIGRASVAAAPVWGACPRARPRTTGLPPPGGGSVRRSIESCPT